MKMNIIDGESFPAELLARLLSVMSNGPVTMEDQGEPTAPEEIEVSPRVMMIDIDYFQSVIAEREALSAQIAEMQEHLICKDCAEVSAQKLRIFAWAGAKLQASAPSLRWNELNEMVRQELYRKAEAELAAFDEAQG